MNQVNLCGNLGANPEVRYTASGTAVCNFRMATNERYTDAQGNKRERVEWHRIVVWGKVAESCGKNLSKGRSVLVTGKLQTRQWEDRDGVKRYTTEIVAGRVQFLGNKPSQQLSLQDTQVDEAPEATIDPEVESEAQALLG